MDYCQVCDRDLINIPAEVRLLVDDVCIQCWLDGVSHGVLPPAEIPNELTPLLPHGQAGEVPG